jgi:hypothetical protein
MNVSCRAAIAAIAILFAMTLRAEEPCQATPEKYKNLEFGDARFALEESCRSTFTQNEQFFIAGIAQRLVATCKLPRNPGESPQVKSFVEAADLALALRKPDGPLDDAITAKPDPASAFAAGRSMMQDVRCNGPEAALLSRGIVIFLRRNPANARFLAGCIEHYAGRFGEKECRCIAATLRKILPDVDRRFFDRRIIKQSIHESPTIALSLRFSCGVAEY